MMKRLNDNRFSKELSDESNLKPRRDEQKELLHVDSIVINDGFPLSVSPQEPLSEMDENIENLMQSPAASVSDADSRRYSSAFTPIRKRDREVSSSPVRSCRLCMRDRVYQFASRSDSVLQLSLLPPFLEILRRSLMSVFTR